MNALTDVVLVDTDGNRTPRPPVYNGGMVMIEALISFICLVSLIVILLEAQRNGGFRRKWPIAVWAGSLLALSLLGLLRVFTNLENWSDARILLGILGASNFLFGAALLVRWLFWRPPTST